MKTKAISILLVIAMLFCLSACGQTASPAPSAAESPAPTPNSTPEQDLSSVPDPSPEPDPVSEREAAAGDIQEGEASSNPLIVYFSWSSSGNTEKMASFIQEHTGGSLLEIEPSVPYPADCDQCTQVALAERDENQRPAIANLPEDLSEYDAVFIGYPIWWHTAPMIIGTFLEHYDLTGVEVYPFSQSGSMDREQFENSMDFVRESAAGANVHEGLFVQPEDTQDIQDYLIQNGFAG